MWMAQIAGQRVQKNKARGKDKDHGSGGISLQGGQKSPHGRLCQKKENEKKKKGVAEEAGTGSREVTEELFMQSLV